MVKATNSNAQVAATIIPASFSTAIGLTDSERVWPGRPRRPELWEESRLRCPGEAAPTVLAMRGVDTVAAQVSAERAPLCEQRGPGKL